MFDAKVDDGVNSIEGTCLTRVDTPKRTIILGHIVAGFILLVLGIQGAFTFTQKMVRICEITNSLVPDSPCLLVDLSNLKGGVK
jgi:hypothetical protein